MEDRRLLAGLPTGAMPDDTAEYLLGDVLVNVVLMESDGSIDPSSEDWTSAQIEQVKENVRDGMQWWSDTLATLTSVHSLNFTYDFTYADNPVATGYEPISRRSDDVKLWVDDFLDEVGYNTFNSFTSDIRTYNHDQRVAHDVDWAFTVFVVNDHNDDDGMFADGGSFLQAFAYAGGRLMVVPAGRPVSTYSHEMGHIFWARDEYAKSASYYEFRGYYRTQNLNAVDDHPEGDDFVPLNSLMQNGSYLLNAFQAKTSSPSSLEMVGWKDSDGDGVFDVLDVPLSLEGTGFYDVNAGVYRFRGEGAVATLPNLNTDGLKNDITLNEISQVAYQIDGGGWNILVDDLDQATIDLDLQIPVDAAPHQIELKLVSLDPVTQQVVTESPVFSGQTHALSSVNTVGLNGVAFFDEDSNGDWNQGESGSAGWTIDLTDANGDLLQLKEVLEPDDYSDFELVNEVHPDVTLKAIGISVQDDRVSVGSFGTSSTGTKTFIHRSMSTQSWSADWTDASRNLRMDFSTPVASVSLDAIARNRDGYGRMDAYDVDGNLIARYTTGLLQGTNSETMTIQRDVADIAYVIARGHLGTSVRLDQLQFGAESTTTTDGLGAFQFASLPSMTYFVKATPPADWLLTSPQTIEVSYTAGETIAGLEFGGTTEISWTNPANPLDVSGDTLVAPIDVLLIVNDLNLNGSRELEPPSQNLQPPPFPDVNGDMFLSPLDALLVINYLNGDASGEGTRAAAAISGSVGEGEVARSEWFATTAEFRFEAFAAPAAEAIAEQPDGELFPSITSGNDRIVEVDRDRIGSESSSGSRQGRGLPSGVSFRHRGTSLLDEFFACWEAAGGDEADEPWLGDMWFKSK